MPRLKPQAKLCPDCCCGRGSDLRAALRHAAWPDSHPGDHEVDRRLARHASASGGGAGGQRAGAALSLRRSGQRAGHAYHIRCVGVECDVLADLRQRRPGDHQGFADGEERRESDAAPRGLEYADGQRSDWLRQAASRWREDLLQGSRGDRRDGRQRRPVALQSESASEEAGAGVSGGDHRRGGPLQRRRCAARPRRVEDESAEHEGQDRRRRHSRRRLEYRAELHGIEWPQE